MNNSNIGRGPFIFMLVLTVVWVIALIINALSPADMISTMMSAKWLFVTYVVLTGFVIWNSVLAKGWNRTLWVVSLVFIITFTAEALGVNFGLIFGRYYYTEALGIQVGGVPLLAALAWQPILYAAYCVTDILIPSPSADRSDSLLRRLPYYVGAAVVGALLTTAWDMMIDPFAVSQGYWVWLDGGPYVPYLESGVPISNYLGWLGTAFVCQLMYRFIMGTGPRPRVSLNISVYGPLMLYFYLFITSAGLTMIIVKRPELGLTALMGMGIIVAVALMRVIPLKRGVITTLGEGLLGINNK
ncbi:MAG: carotenoid biosynthesis protein [Thermodesulfobacteriota bacterium]|nr:carotenoid biosynthesis protein [Thermodesulfobacteriota bacterium]